MVEYHLAQEAKEFFDGKIELNSLMNESYFGGITLAKVSVTVVPVENCCVWSFKT